jgi:23S rRNA U2552 (ribose-2'-O)-methylase RlmE/FtsJ
MIYFLIPKMHNKLYEYLECNETNTPSDIPKLSSTLAHYLYDIKEQIQQHVSDWDVYKKYTNTYEYIHSSVPAKKKSVAKYKPLSRSYFKMIELIELFHLEPTDRVIRSFHLAEGPGGFIEALAHMRNCKEDRYYGMTLLDDKNDEMIPAWKKSNHFLDENRNVFIETGADKTGNLLSIENLKYCKEKYGSSMNFISADGGFDFSLDFNNQEQNMAKLLFAQICYALCMQSFNGSFVLKIFDCFTEASLDMLALLSSFYKKVYITKPNTSRSANSEKYVVCKGFLYNENASFYPFIYKTFKHVLQLKQDSFINRLLPSYSIPYYFLTKIEEYNSIFGQQQIENIHYTLSLIETKPKPEKIESIIKANVQKCMYWCIKHNIQYNILFRDMQMDSPMV